MTDGTDVERARAQVALAHELVAAGRYAPAIAAFQEAWEVLRGALGPDHPEVEELALDLEAARQMAEAQAFGREAGLRGWDGPEPDPEPEA